MLSSLTTAKWLYNNNKNPKCKQWPLIALHSNEVIMTPQDFLLEMNKSHGIASAALQKNVSSDCLLFKNQGIIFDFCIPWWLNYSIVVLSLFFNVMVWIWFVRLEQAGDISFSYPIMEDWRSGAIAEREKNQVILIKNLWSRANTLPKKSFRQMIYTLGNIN